MKTIRETRNLPLPTTKKCNDPECPNTNPQPAEDFYLVKRRLKSTGEVRYSLNAYCKTCCRKRANAHRDSLSSEEKTKRDKERMERYNKKHGKERHREIKRRSKKKVRHQEEKVPVVTSPMPDMGASNIVGGKKDPDDYLPRGPFVEWLTGKNGWVRKDIAVLATSMEIDRKVLDRVVHGKDWYRGKEVVVEDVHKALVDRALVADGLNTQPWQLYTELGE